DATAVVEELLAITGEDPRDIHRKFLPAINTTLGVRFVLMSNELPGFKDASGAFMGRVILLRMKNSFLGREDRSLENRIRSELPGVLNWAIRGWQRLEARGHFLQPASGGNLLEDFAAMASPIGEF